MNKSSYKIINRKAKQFFKYDLRTFLAQSGRHYSDILRLNKNLTSLHPTIQDNRIRYAEIITLCANKAFLKLDKSSQHILTSLYLDGKKNMDMMQELNKKPWSYCMFKDAIYKEFAKYFAYYQKESNISPVYFLD